MFRSTAHVYDLVYELVGKDYGAESAALADLVRERNPDAQTLLDVACGTGGHLVHLRDRFAVAGVDLDPGMLDVARRKLPGIDLVEGDMRTVDLGRRFDAVVCLFSSIGYLRDLAELDAAVANMAAYLAPGGVLVIDGWIRPDAWREDLSVHALSGVRDGTAVARVGRSTRDGRRTVLDLHHLVATEDEVQHLVDRHELTLFDTEEYLGAFERAGLSVELVEAPHAERDRFVGLRARGR